MSKMILQGYRTKSGSPTAKKTKDGEALFVPTTKETIGKKAIYGGQSVTWKTSEVN